MSSQYSNINDPEAPTDGRSNPVITFSKSSKNTSRPGRLLNRSTGRSVIKYRHRKPQNWFAFINDGFTTVINAQWYWIILLFATLYIVSWFSFGLLWWTVDVTYESIHNSSCVSNIEGFTSSFLFSLETQMTIGYGFRFIVRDCHFGVLVLIIQCVVGLLIDSFLLGLIFTKIARPRNRRRTILFSDQACIHVREDGQKCLQFRVADVRAKSSLVEAHVRVQVYWYKTGVEGERVLHQKDLDVGYDTGIDRIILLTPVIVTHVIDESSPLYSLNEEEDYVNQDIEIVVILEAIVESTGLTAQALWSYTERELMFGYKFRPMTYRKENSSWEADFSLISSIVPCSDPTNTQM